MYTRCPACLTIFKVTPAQLDVRGGMVRCGICSAVFHAEQQKMRPRSEPATAETLVTPAPVLPEKRKHGGRGRRRSGRRRTDKLRFIDEKLAQEAGIPTVSRRPLLPPRISRASVLWGAGSVVLLLLLAGQFIFHYRHELATLPTWRPVLADLCRYVGCTLHPFRDISNIELVQTSIAPHPQYEHVLRLRAQLVNRAAFPQPYPRMEVSLTNNDGKVIARRAFAPIQYSETPLEGALTPNVVAAARLELINPDGQAVGFEIRLIAP